MTCHVKNGILCTEKVELNSCTMVKYLVVYEVGRVGTFEITKESTDLHIVSVEPFLTAYGRFEDDLESKDLVINTSEGDICIQVGKSLYSVLTLPVGNGSKTITVIAGLIIIHEDAFFQEKIHLDFEKHFTIGHRGMGSNLVSKEYQENTMSGFKCAYEKNVDFIEFDVQLSSERIPVIHHDFYISYKDKKDFLNEPINENKDGGYNYSINQFNLEQFVNSKLHLEWNQKLPTFKELMTELPKDLKFDVEIKYPYQAAFNGIVPYEERNSFIDRVLEEMEKCNENRKLFFSTFDFICAAMLCLKQKRWPVLQLMTMEAGENIKKFKERILGISQIWKEIGIKGFVLDSTMLLQIPDVAIKLREMGFVVATYGSPNNDSDKIKKQFDIGVQGIATDKLSLLQKTINEYEEK